MARQAKCPKCRVRYTWYKEILLKNTFCPKCETKLLQTSSELEWPTIVEEPVIKVFVNGRWYSKPETEALLEKARKINSGFQVQQAEAILGMF